LATTSAREGLKLNNKMFMKIGTNTPISVGNHQTREVETFVYLENVIDKQGGTDREVTTRIRKTMAAQEHLGIKVHVNLNIDKDTHLQLQCQISPLVQLRDLEKDRSYPA
jgi:hypothetical protein